MIVSHEWQTLLHHEQRSFVTDIVRCTTMPRVVRYLNSEEKMTENHGVTHIL